MTAAAQLEVLLDSIFCFTRLVMGVDALLKDTDSPDVLFGNNMPYRSPLFEASGGTLSCNFCQDGGSQLDLQLLHIVDPSSSLWNLGKRTPYRVITGLLSNCHSL